VELHVVADDGGHPLACREFGQAMQPHGIARPAAQGEGDVSVVGEGVALPNQLLPACLTRHVRQQDGDQLVAVLDQV
jgi:hypothetical protein